jgi:hypothetical protein
MSQNSEVVQRLIQTGQVASFVELEKLVFGFEEVLKRFGITIQSGSELEGTCCSVLEVLGKNQGAAVRNSNEDIREVFTEVLGIWTFLKKIVRLQDHRCFAQFVPHLNLLNKGTVVQNKRVRACQEATNKIFELLVALVLLDVSDDVILDHPDLAKGDNPDVLATIDGKCWGFACKTVYGASGKTFFDNLEKGVDQIEAARRAELGVVVVNFRNFIRHEECWPLLNEYRTGAEPIFASHLFPEQFVVPRVRQVVAEKQQQVVAEVGIANVVDVFAGKKALPAFLAFCQTCSGKVSALGPIPTSIITLCMGTFGDCQAHQDVFKRINSALHEH